MIVVQNVFPGQDDQLGNGNYYSVGLHPWNIKKNSIDENMNWVRMQAERNDVIAIGETGLDKSIDCPWQYQTEVFERHLNIAEKMEKPVILHCVRAYSEMMAYRKQAKQKIPWIFHWFNENLRTAEELIKRNCYLSFGHMLFRENSRAYKTFISIPPEYLFFETDDAGYNIHEIYEQAACLKSIDMDELKVRIVENFNTCFGIDE